MRWAQWLAYNKFQCVVILRLFCISLHLMQFVSSVAPRIIKARPCFLHLQALDWWLFFFKLSRYLKKEEIKGKRLSTNGVPTTTTVIMRVASSFYSLVTSHSPVGEWALNFIAIYPVFLKEHFLGQWALESPEQVPDLQPQNFWSKARASASQMNIIKVCRPLT